MSARFQSPRPRRPLVAPRFGAMLRRWRGRQSRGEVCRMLASKGLAIDRSTLLQYERGTVRNPSIAIVWTLAKYYGVTDRDFGRLIGLLVHELTGDAPSRIVHGLEPGDDPEQRRLAAIVRGFPTTLQKSVITILRRLADAEVARGVVASRRSRAS